MIKSNANTHTKLFKNNDKKKIFVIGSLASLLAACGSKSAVSNLNGESTTGDDVLSLVDDKLTAIIDGGSGDDTITGGDQIDFIRGGTGSDTTNSGAGVGNILIIGITGVDEYDLSDIENPNGVNIDLTSLISLDDLNNHTTSDLSIGETINGGVDGAILFVYGEVDFTGVTLANITRLDVHSQITLPADVLNGLLADAKFEEFEGDGTSHIIIPNSSSPIVLNLSAVDMHGIKHLTIGENVTLIVDSNDIATTTIIDGDGSIQSVTGLLALDGKQISVGITILNAAGNTIIPEFTGDFSVNMDENSISVGTFSVTNASSVGDVTYAISGADAGLFNINTATGEINFNSTPNFENATDDGADNVHDIIITATDEHQISVPQNITITIADVNEQPNGSVSIAGTTTQGQVLTVSDNLSDGDGLGAISYQWQADGLNISSATNSTYKLTQAEVGKAISVKASYTDGSGTAESVTSANTAAIVNVNDLAEGSVTITGIAKEGKTLTASHNLTDIDGLGEISYQWLAGGVNISDATSATYVLTQAEVGQPISVKASYVDGQGTAESISSDATDSVNDSPNGTVFASGSASVEQGNVFTAFHTNLTDADGLGTISYQWLADDVFISGATNVTYTLTQAEVGKTISVAISYTDGLGVDESLTSANTIAVSNVNDAPVGAVSISGVFEQGEELTLSHNLTDIDGLGAITYQWLADGAVISGATGATYTLTSVELGKAVSVTASYTDLQLTAESVASASGVVTVGSSLGLDALNGAIGFRIDGEGADDFFGDSVSFAGDVNGDGYDDLIIGAYGTEHPDGSNYGASYVVFGQSSSFSSAMLLSSLDGSNGFKIAGLAPYQFGGSVSSAGDVNGDGYDELIIGAKPSSLGTGGSFSGSSYVIFGQSSSFLPSLDLASLTGTNGFRIDGADVNDFSASSVASAGDVNGDGYDDLLIGAYGANSFDGKSYIVFGQSSAFSSTLNLSSLTGANGFEIIGGADSFGMSAVSGGSVSLAGDVNGDGYDDFIVGANGADFNGAFSTGSSYVIFGRSSYTSTLDLSNLNVGDGFRIDGSAFGHFSGGSVSSAGDINGDGFDDLIIGATGADHNSRTDSGSSYVLFGQAADFSLTMDLSTPDGSTFFRIDGATSSEKSGFSVSSAGDVNGDGYDDLIIGAPEAGSGSSYVVFGQSSGFSATIDLATLDGSTGFRIDGVAVDDKSGASVSSAGDINGDGYDDLIIGSPDTGSGSSYVIFGGVQFGASVNTATAGDDIVVGDSGSNTLNGGDGDDGLSGLGGDDVLIGGNGADLLIGSTGVDQLWGGGMIDNFSFAAGDTNVTISGAGDAGEIVGFDTIHDFQTNGVDFASEIIDTVGTPTIVADTVGFTGGTASNLTIDTSVVNGHSVTNGVINFGNSSGGGIEFEVSGNNDAAAIIEYLQLQDLGNAGSTVTFDYGADAFIFTQGSDDGLDNSLDVVIYLENTQVDNLITVNALGDFDLMLT